MPDNPPELPTFKGTHFPEFLLEKYLLEHPAPERPFILKRLKGQARETLNFELARAVRMYEEMSRDLTVKFSGQESPITRPEV